jgi:hypothetical protein
MIPREIHILLHEPDPKEEEHLVQMISKTMPDGYCARIQWTRRLNEAIMRLINPDSPYTYALAISTNPRDAQLIGAVNELLGVNTPCIFIESNEDINRLIREYIAPLTT